MVKIWMYWGVKLDCVFGYSVGEIIVVIIVGVFIFEDVCKLIVDCVCLMGEIEWGSMFVVFVNELDMESLIWNYDDVLVCVVNGLFNIVVGGKFEYIEVL